MKFSFASMRFLILGTICLCFMFVCLGAGASTVTQISWESQPGFNKFIIRFDELPRFNAVNNLKDSNLFYVDCYGLKLNYKRRLIEIENDNTLKYVDALSYPDHGVLRLVFYAKESGSSFNIQTETNPPRLIINTVRPGSAAPTPAPGAQIVNSSTSSQPPYSATSQVAVTTASISNQVGFQLPQIPPPSRGRPAPTHGGKKYVFIDPGHGGANTGAKSHVLVNGQYVNEEDLTLQFAYELKKLVDANPNMVGLLTRVENTNVGLYDRVKFAEDNADANGSSLFISIHMNDAPNTDAHGMEVYFLNEKGTVDAAVREKEKMENRDVGLGSKNNNSILDNMLTSLKKDLLQDWQYESYILCRRIEQSLLTYPYFAQSNRGVKNANFVVLKNFKMPAVLLEVGFISNSDELRYLMSPQFQQQTAALVYNAINAYFAENDPSYKPQYKAVTGQRR